MRLHKGLLLPALLAATSIFLGHASAKKDSPTLKRTAFDSEPLNLFYFDDSEVLLALEEQKAVWRSPDSGLTWDKVDIPEEKHPWVVLKNPYDNKVAVALGTKKTHWITYDQGEKWTPFESEEHHSRAVQPISFHADDSKKILFHGGERHIGLFASLGKTWYTEDGFDSMKLARESRQMCIWAKSTDLFESKDKDIDDNRILCVVEGRFSDKPHDYRLVVSDNNFKDEEEITVKDQNIKGFANIAAVKSFIVAAAKSPGTDELALYTTVDTKVWNKAEFGEHKVTENAYTILESTNYSIQVDVQAHFNGEGALFSSNSDGHWFTKHLEHTNRDQFGFVDFERISSVQGVIIANTIDNWEKAETDFVEKKTVSKISFDDGRNFTNLKTRKDKDLHVHSVTDLKNSGRVFSSPAPGIVMAVGNTGEYLERYDKGDLYVSDDGGLTWELALENAHKYEFGDKGAVLVAVYDEGETDEIRFSFRHGKGGDDEWGTAKLEKKMRAVELTTVSDSTSLRFILVGYEGGDGRNRQWVTYGIDFKDVHERECKEDDFETWHARVDEKGQPLCIMGRKQSFRRRKADAECFVNEEFKDPVSQWDTCQCEDADYECDSGYMPEFDKGIKVGCSPIRGVKPPKDACKNDEKTYMRPSGWRRIPGNECEVKDGKGKDKEEVEAECDGEINQPPSGKVIAELTNKFDGAEFKEYWYLERCQVCEGTDETVIALTGDRNGGASYAYLSHDHGKVWERILEDEEVLGIIPHQYANDVVFLITPKRAFYSYERGLTGFKSFEVPSTPAADAEVLQFHPKNQDWFIWTGRDKHGLIVAQVTSKIGYENSWKVLLAGVGRCQFMWSESMPEVDEHRIFCDYRPDGDKKQLVASNNYFEDKEVKFDDLVSFATMSDYIVVATKTEDRKWLKLDTSVDSENFADAKWPPKLDVGHETAYTVLDSSTRSVFLHVTVNAERDREYGSIVKSNSNGTSYVLSINEVNRNREGYVDFEKMQGIEGVALANVVANKVDVDNASPKKLRTKITHNDGADWDYLQAPQKDFFGKGYTCDVSDSNKEKCALHLHGYTERVDPRNTFSSPTAVGLMLGVGNVGEYLGELREGNTYLTRDGGVIWKEVKNGAYFWEFGDQGSVIVLVKRFEETSSVLYSTDEGDNWTKFDFVEGEKKMNVDMLTTVPSDTSLKFILWGSLGGKPYTVHLDFSGLFERDCELDDNDPEAGDYYLWSPKHPKQDDNCLFGHVAQYHRKIKGTLCKNPKRIDAEHSRPENCPCTRRDFECDYNYERQNDMTCALVQGLAPPEPTDVCKNENVIEYHDTTGYRKIPLSTCEGGRQLDGETRPCPGHEEEYEKKHGTSGFVIFLAIVLPIAAAAGIGYWVWKNWSSKFGQIRLGDGSGYSVLDGDAPWIRWPVVAVSGIVAVLAAIPMLIGSLWSSGRGRFGGGYGGRTYNSRSSFARGRGDYAVVDPDEGELLGDDSDEDV